MGITHALSTGSRRGLVATVAAGVFAISGAAVIVYAFTHQPPPQPELSVAASPTPTVAPTEAPTVAPTVAPTDIPTVAPRVAPTVAPTRAPAVSRDTPKGVGPVLPASQPVALAIPAIGVQTSILHLGLTPQGSLEVPAPGPDYNKAAWYRHSPTPGELGPSIINGHIDSAADGPSVFYKLGALRVNDKVRITRADGKVAVFEVDEVRRFHKKQFPTWLVYGDTTNAALRLITCGGPFDRDSGSYLDNIIVLASLVKS